MKRIITYFITVAMVFSLTGCVNITVNTPPANPTPTAEPTASPQPEQTPETTGDESRQWATDRHLAAIYEEWRSLIGYWNTVEKGFVVLDMEDSHSAVFKQGIWEAGGGRDYGRITALKKSADMEITAQVLYPYQEATEMEDRYEELTQIIVIDYSGKEQDGKIRIKIDDGDFLQYRFAGWFSEDAYKEFTKDYYG